MRRLISPFCVLGLVFTIGCDSDDDAAAEADDSSQAERQPETEPEVRETVTYQLSEGDEDWEGWSIEAAEGLDVIGDLSGPRLTEDGFDAIWDLLLAKGHRDLDEIREVQAGHAEDNDDLTVEFVKEEEDFLAWTRRYGEGDGASTTWNFIRHVTVDGAEVTCQTNLQNGASSEALMKQQQKACDTLSGPAAEE